MDQGRLQSILKDVRDKKTSVQKALEQLRVFPYENMGFAKVDHHRTLRQGFPEVILCEGKSVSQILDIAKSLVKRHSQILATRVEPKVARALKRWNRQAVYSEIARTVVIPKSSPGTQGEILILTAGTSDIPVAEEAKVTANVMGSRVHTVYDVGVAGLHRVLDQTDQLRQARVIIVVAGMDGVLPSVVNGLVDRPIIAVPTSQGYGTHLGGLAPLFTMLNACSGGVGVVNIDNGYGAGCLAHRINVQPGEN